MRRKLAGVGKRYLQQVGGARGRLPALYSTGLHKDKAAMYFAFAMPSYKEIMCKNRKETKKRKERGCINLTLFLICQ